MSIETSPFSFARLQEFLTISDYLDREAIPLDQVREYVQARNQAIAELSRASAEHEREWAEKTFYVLTDPVENITLKLGAPEWVLLT